MGAVFLGGLRHEADVGDGAHGAGIEGAVLFAEVDRGLVNACVAAVGYDGEGVLLFAGLVPHLAGGADHGGHGGVHNDVGGDVEIGDTLVGIDHGEGGAGGVGGGDVGLDGGFLGGGEFLDFGEEVAEAVVEINAEGGEDGGVLGEQVFEEDAHEVAEDDRVGDLHHGGLEVDGEEDAVGLGLGELRLDESEEGFLAQDGGVEDLAGLEGSLVLEDNRSRSPTIGRAYIGNELDADGGGGGDGDGLLVGEEVVLAHGADGGLGGGGPGAHGVWVLLGVGLDGTGGAAVGVALAEDGVDGGTKNLGVAGAGVLLGVGGGVLGEGGEGIALGLELGDGGLQLGNGGGDVGELDDVGLGLEREGAEFGQGVGHALGGGKEVGENGEDAGGNGNVARLHGDACVLGKGLHDGQETVGGEGGSLVGDGVEAWRTWWESEGEGGNLRAEG